MMNWKILKTEQDYAKATTEGTPETDGLELLIILVQDYDNRHYVLPTLTD